MAAYDFLTTDEVLIFAQDKGPQYPVEVNPQKNVVHAVTVGGRVKSQVRGSDRKRLVLHWRSVSEAQLANILAWHATYGGMRQPFKVELPGGLTELADGSRLPVRSVQQELDYELAWYKHYNVTVELIEDLVVETICVHVSEALAIAEILTHNEICFIASESLTLSEVAPIIVGGVLLSASDGLALEETEPQVLAE